MSQKVASSFDALLTSGLVCRTIWPAQTGWRAAKLCNLAYPAFPQKVCLCLHMPGQVMLCLLPAAPPRSPLVHNSRWRVFATAGERHALLSCNPQSRRRQLQAPCRGRVLADPLSPCSNIAASYQRPSQGDEALDYRTGRMGSETGGDLFFSWCGVACSHGTIVMALAFDPCSQASMPCLSVAGPHTACDSTGVERRNLL